MKTNICKYAVHLLLGLGILLGAGSCTDFLEEKSRTDQNVDDIQDLASLNIALVGVYSRLQGCFATNAMALGELGTDITFTSKQGNATLPVDSYAITPSTVPPTNYWKNHFTLVRDANIVLDKAEQFVADGIIPELEGNAIIAQTRVLRAFAYFRLMEAFAELPLIEQSIDIIGRDEFTYARSSIDDVFHFIEADLTKAIWSNALGEKNGGRVNKWAAKSLLAKLYLYVGTSKHRNEVGTPSGAVRSDNGAAILGGYKNLIPGYSEVAESCEELYGKANGILSEIISQGGFSLTAKYQDPFIPMNKNNNSESIWEIQYAAQPGYGSDWSKQFGLSTGLNQQTFSCVGGQLAYQPAPGFYKYFRLGDMRREVNISHRRIVYFADGTIQSEADSFTLSGRNLPVVNPANNKSILINYNADLNSDDEVLLSAAFLQPALSLQLGSWKYGWGQGSDPSRWKTEKMAYAMSDCPNNVVVFRYADILLMYAETDMLMRGADPSNPQGAHASQQAVDRVNEVVARALGYRDPAVVHEEFRAQFEAQAEISKIDYETAKTAYDADNKNDNKFKTFHLAQRKWLDIRHKLAHLDDLVLKPYTTSTLTYEELVDERARELCFEFQRWFDLQRLGWLEYKVLRRRVNYQSFPLPVIELPKHYLYPLPIGDTDLSLNPDFKKNNPGYGAE